MSSQSLGRHQGVALYTVGQRKGLGIAAGVRKIDYGPINKVISHVRKKTAAPCAVGFGIGTPEAAVEAASRADAVIVGSAVVRHIMEGNILEGMELISSMRQALDENYQG